MRNSRSKLIACAFALAPLFSERAHAGDLTVLAVEPARHALRASVNAPIVIHFDRPIQPESLESGRELSAFGRWSGTVQGTYQISNGNSTVTLSPNNPFSAGETVMVIISHNVQAVDGSRLRDGGYSYQFWTAAGRNSRGYQQIGVLTTRTSQAQSSRAYGGIASDLNGDRFLDITIVNEDTADLRVFLNQADGTGLYHEFTQPTFPVNDRASPSEPADFNRDGHTDICVANIDTNSVSVLLGNGDGTFAPQQEIAVGATPRGIAVLDVDGDGDVDIVNTNRFSNNLSLLRNDGTGVFGSPTFFEGGGNGEWALAAADMNDDGLLDLVVGAQTSRNILVHTANGDGTFSLASSTDSGGDVWMLVCGDVNGDGTEDVAVVNSRTNNGAILLGDGKGGLSAPQTYPTDPFPLATDLGDLDGDGDLDWVTSSFSGDWFLFANDGRGGFTFDQSFPAPRAASCALMLDIDNDGDLDLGLIDELEDVVILMRHDGQPGVNCTSDEDCDNGAFCDGPESCDAEGECIPGVAPCLVDQICVEESDRCIDCLDDEACDDSRFCTEDRCVDGVCDNRSILYGDGNLDGTIDLTDILCVLDGFAGSFERCTFATLDIADCAPNGQIDLSDILAVLDAFAGLQNCCDG